VPFFETFLLSSPSAVIIWGQMGKVRARELLSSSPFFLFTKYCSLLRECKS
jgi:hypothetical protein